MRRRTKTARVRKMVSAPAEMQPVGAVQLFNSTMDNQQPITLTLAVGERAGTALTHCLNTAACSLSFLARADLVMNVDRGEWSQVREAVAAEE
mmetsp:Transcript_54344/g.95389  ORF Transcript_54344/g.95389 Transcript_54344/m.95389 type:complete len:93 (-) Transcript_54344:936-1214(-)